MAKIDLTGQKFGRLTVLLDIGRTERGQVIWQCACSCGGSKNVPAWSLRSGTVKSCGCLKTQVRNAWHHAFRNQKRGNFTPGGSIEDLEDLVR